MLNHNGYSRRISAVVTQSDIDAVDARLARLAVSPLRSEKNAFAESAVKPCVAGSVLLWNRRSVCGGAERFHVSRTGVAIVLPMFAAAFAFIAADIVTSIGYSASFQAASADSLLQAPRILFSFTRLSKSLAEDAMKHHSNSPDSTCNARNCFIVSSQSRPRDKQLSRIARNSPRSRTPQEKWFRQCRREKMYNAIGRQCAALNSKAPSKGRVSFWIRHRNDRHDRRSRCRCQSQSGKASKSRFK